jgi:hypothetical protein
MRQGPHIAPARSFRPTALGSEYTRRHVPIDELLRVAKALDGKVSWSAKVGQWVMRLESVDAFHYCFGNTPGHVLHTLECVLWGTTRAKTLYALTDTAPGSAPQAGEHARLGREDRRGRQL